MKVINRLILTLGLLAAVTTSMSAGDAIALKVPFNFTAGDRMLPAGTYSFSQLLAYPETLKIQNRDPEVSPIFIQVRISDSTSTPHLVFDRVGQRHFLREVSTYGFRFETSPSGAEKRWTNRLENDGEVTVVGQ
jgi:hypothetical protein